MSAAEVFFDSNVLLYLLSNDNPRADRAEALIAEGGTISVQVLNEIASVGLGKLGLAMGEIREVLGTIRRLCRVVPVDAETHDLGLDIAERHRLSLYDSLIVAAALRAKCTVLYSEDMQDGQRFGSLRLRNPFAK
jgi:predicted nucleic acid-binding protein